MSTNPMAYHSKPFSLTQVTVSWYDLGIYSSHLVALASWRPLLPASRIMETMWGECPDSSLPQSQNNKFQFQSQVRGQVLLTWPRTSAHFSIQRTVLRIPFCPEKENRMFRCRDADREVYSHLYKKPAASEWGFVMISKSINTFLKTLMTEWMATVLLSWNLSGLFFQWFTSSGHLHFHPLY